MISSFPYIGIHPLAQSFYLSAVDSQKLVPFQRHVDRAKSFALIHSDKTILTKMGHVKTKIELLCGPTDG